MLCLLDPWEKVYFRSQILERPSIGEYWKISCVPVLPENVIFTFFWMCWCYSEAFNTGMQKWSSIVQYSCTSIWDLKYTFSDPCFSLESVPMSGLRMFTGLLRWLFCCYCVIIPWNIYQYLSSEGNLVEIEVTTGECQYLSIVVNAWGVVKRSGDPHLWHYWINQIALIETT